MSTMIGSSILQRTLHTLAPWSRHWLQPQSTAAGSAATSRITTIQIKPTATQTRFALQRQQSERFADTIIARQTPKPIVNTIRREPSPQPVPPPPAFPLAGGRTVALPDRPAALFAPAIPAATLEEATPWADSWLLRQPQPTGESAGSTLADASNSTALPVQDETASPTELAAHLAQRPQLESVAEEIEQRIQRAAAIRRGEEPTPPVMPPAEAGHSAEQTAIQRRVVGAPVARPTAAAASAPVASPAEQVRPTPATLTGEPPPQSQPMSPVEPVVLPSDAAQSASPLATATPASLVGEIQRRIAQAAQTRLSPSTPTQPQPSAPSGTAQPPTPPMRRPTSTPTAPTLPPQVRRMRAVSQVEEIGARSPGLPEPLPIARPASPADLAQATSVDAPTTLTADTPVPATTPTLLDGTPTPQSAVPTPAPPISLETAPTADTTEMPTHSLVEPVRPLQAASGQEMARPIQRYVDTTITSATHLADPASPPEEAAPVAGAPVRPSTQAVAATPTTSPLSSPAPVVQRTAVESTMPPITVSDVHEADAPDPKVMQMALASPNVVEAGAPVVEQPTPAMDATGDITVQRRASERGQPAPVHQPMVVAANPVGSQDAAVIQPPVTDSSAASDAEGAPVTLPAAEGHAEMPSASLPTLSIVRTPETIQRQSRQIQAQSAHRPTPAVVAQPDSSVAQSSTERHSALAMPLVAPPVQRRQPPAAHSAAMAPSSTSAAVQRQPFLPSALIADALVEATAAQPTPPIAPPQTGPSIERRIDLNAVAPVSALYTSLSTALPSAIQRQPTASAPLPQLAGLTTTAPTASETPSLDLDMLARELMPMVKRLLSVEREREPRFE